MGCRLSKDDEGSLSLECLNMLVLGYSEAGKTKILSCLRGQQCEEKNTLQINTIILNRSLKLMAFEVSGKAEKTWKNYYSCCDIVMIVIDASDQQSQEKIRQKILQIDGNIKPDAKIFVVLNKIDLLNMSTQFNDTETTKANNQPTSTALNLQTLVKKLKLSSLSHEFSFSHCSAETGQGIKELGKKLYEFAVMTKLKHKK